MSDHERARKARKLVAQELSTLAKKLHDASLTYPYESDAAIIRYAGSKQVDILRDMYLNETREFS